jgi:phage gp36-like protein
MPYATVAHLVAEFGEREVIDLTDRAEPPLGEVDKAVAQGALDRAEATINGYLAGRYLLPLVETPPQIKGIALDLARHALYINVMPDVVKDRYDAAMRDLKAIASGLQALPLATVGNAAPAGGGLASRTRPKEFG